MSTFSLINTVSYKITLNYPNAEGFPPPKYKIIWSLTRNGQLVSGINFPEPVEFFYENDHYTATLFNVVVNPAPEQNPNIALQDGDILGVRLEAKNEASEIPAVLEANATIVAVKAQVTMKSIALRDQNNPTQNLIKLDFDTDNDPTGKILIVADRTSSSFSDPVVRFDEENPIYYTWKRNNTIIKEGFASTTEENNNTYEITENDKDTVISVEALLTINPTNFVKRETSIVIGQVESGEGFTQFYSPEGSDENGPYITRDGEKIYTNTESYIVYGPRVIASPDSRIVYIAENGDDTLASQAKDRGYYLPSDEEIGSDPTQPTGSVVAYRNPQEAMKVLRGKGAPEWVLFQRGDTFPNSIMDGNYTYWGQGGPTFGGVGIWTWAWTGTAFSYEAGRYSGRSDKEPFVIGAWGTESLPRPLFPSIFSAIIPNSIVSSIDVKSRSGLQYSAVPNLLLEDCRSQGHSMIGISFGGPTAKVTLRRCVYADGWNPSGHNSAPFIGAEEGTKITFEECVFDRNGYKENPNEPRTWTGEEISNLVAGELPIGTGVQPTRTWFDRNWYLSGSAGRTLKVRGNIASRTGGGGEQFRSGGVAERNLLLFDHDGIVATGFQGNTSMIAKDNVHLHDDAMRPPGGYGMNNQVRSQDGVYWIGNIHTQAHHYGQNGGGTIHLLGESSSIPINGWRATVLDNIIRSVNPIKGWGIEDGNSFANNQAEIRNNVIAIDNPQSWLGASASSVPRSDDIIDENLYFGNPSSNLFSLSYVGSPRFVPVNRTFTQWQQAGFDPNGQMIQDWEEFKTTAGWTDPDRDIVSYMQHIDPTYVPDEDVRVDFGCTGLLQETPQLVRNVVTGNDTQQRQVARRFHAFVTFINRARDNRRGDWNYNYTAESVINYIREGFGKDIVSGKYDERTIEEIVSDYIFT